MVLTSAEKQQPIAITHGTKERHFAKVPTHSNFISVQTRVQLGRLACHYGYTVTKMIEDLAADAERTLFNRLSPHLDGHHQQAGQSTMTPGIRPGPRKGREARREVTV